MDSRRSMKCQAVELGDQPLIVPVDRQSGETVAFAEHKPVCRFRASQSQNFLTELDGRGQRLRPESFIERAVVPAIEPDPDCTCRVIQSACDEWPSWVSTSTESPAPGSPATLAIDASKTQG